MEIPSLPWVSIAIYAAVFAAGAATGGTVAYKIGYYNGHKEVEALQKQILDDQADKIKAIQLAVAKQAAQDAVSEKAAVEAAQKLQKIVTVTNTIVKKVPVYVTQKTDAAFPLPCGFVRLHDAAATGVDPDQIALPTGKSDGDACPVAASVAARIIAENYGQALKWRTQLIGWQGFYSDLRAVK